MLAELFDVAEDELEPESKRMMKESSLRKGPEGFIHFLVLPGLRGK